jgi:hypothetical protein
VNRATRIADAVRAALLHLPVTSNSVSFIIAAQLGRKGVPVDFFPPFYPPAAILYFFSCHRLLFLCMVAILAKTSCS